MRSDREISLDLLLADPAARGQIEAAARSRVEREFGWDTIATQQQRLYREFL